MKSNLSNSQYFTGTVVTENWIVLEHTNVLVLVDNPSLCIPLLTGNKTSKKLL